MKEAKNHIESALITGASAGLGRALLHELGRRGTRVVGVARGRAALEDAIASVRRAGGQAWGIPADVSHLESTTRVALQAAAYAGDIELLVHNASTLGPVPLRPLPDVTAAEVEQVLRVNVVGPLALTR